MNESVNPYAAPPTSSIDREFQPSSPLHRFSWHRIPAYIIGLVGVASLFLGLLGLVVFAYELLVPQYGSIPWDEIAACSFYIGFGALSIACSRYVWRRQYSMAIVLALVSIASLVFMVLVFGF